MVLATAKRSRKGFTDSPAQGVHALMDSGVTQADVSSQVLKGSGNPVVRKHLGSSLIHALRMGCCPSAIQWFVVSVVVDTINRMLRGRTWADVGIEVLKRVQPPLANSDAPTSISGISPLGWARTSLNDSGPCPVLDRVRQSMRYRTNAQFLDSKASTGMSAIKVRGVNVARLSAFATAFVTRVSWVGEFVERQNRQSSVDVSGWKNRLSIVDGHKPILPYFGVLRLVFSKG